jgi:t-SNARE complex subunit (syntaxin)
VLVTEQSQQLDRVELSVELARDRVVAGNKQLREAVELARRARKCYCCGALVVAAVVVVVVVGSVVGALAAAGHAR